MAGVPGRVLTRLLTPGTQWRTGAILLIENAAFEAIWETLVAAPLLPEAEGADPVEVATGILCAACIPASVFMDHRDWQQFRTHAASVVSTADKLKQKLNAPFTAMLQAKADEHTKFSQTGKVWQVGEFIKRLDDDLQFLVELCDLPEPAKPMNHIQPTRPNAKRAKATAKARLLKREMARVYRAPKKTHWGMWRVIADLTTITETENEPFGEDDARKA